MPLPYCAKNVGIDSSGRLDFTRQTSPYQVDSSSVNIVYRSLCSISLELLVGLHE
jgi:hypothetical protein